MLIDRIETNRDKMFEQDKFNKFVIQPTHKHGDFLMLLKLFYNLMKQFNHI